MKQLSEIKIAVDAMGGDHAPSEIIKGVVEFTKKNDIKIVLIGKEELIHTQLIHDGYDIEKIEIINATEIISNDDSPTETIRKKKDSSMVVGLNLLKDNKVDAFISAGNTGALVAGSTLIVGRIKGVQRPALAPLMPTMKGFSLLIDGGANVDAKPIYLKQFAEMGSIYVRDVLDVPNPKVGLINIGTEEKKGNELVREAYALLNSTGGINFIGNLEARDILKGDVDVMVSDAFVGNIVLKNSEGVLRTIFELLKREFKSSFISMIGAMLAKKAFKNLKKRFDHSEYGGAPMLGLTGLVVKAHGSSKSQDIQSAIKQCIKYIEQDITSKIEAKMKKEM